MGDISNAISRASQAGTFRSKLDAVMPRMAAVMPKAMTPDRFYQLAVSCYNQTEKLASCSMESILSSLMQCSALGLEPSVVDGLGRAYIIPRWNSKKRGYEATFLLGFKGMLELARRSGELKDISARAVYEGDTFEYSFGLEEELYHVPSPEPKEGRELAYVYCVAHFMDGGHYIDVMSRSEVDAVRRRFHTDRDGKLETYGPWATDYEAMARKTVLRRAFPYLPISIEAQEAAAVDGTVPQMPVEVQEAVPELVEEPVQATIEEVESDGTDGD